MDEVYKIDTKFPMKCKFCLSCFKHSVQLLSGYATKYLCTKYGSDVEIAIKECCKDTNSI